MPSVRELHRYWSGRWERGRFRPNRTYRECIEQLLGERHAQQALDIYTALPPTCRPTTPENAARVDLASSRIMHGDRAALEPVSALPRCSGSPASPADWTRSRP